MQKIDFTQEASTSLAIQLVYKIESLIFLAHLRDNKFNGRLPFEQAERMEKLSAEIASEIGCEHVLMPWVKRKYGNHFRQENDLVNSRE